MNPDTADATSPDPGLAEVIDQWRRGIFLDLRVAAPATVIEYNSATQTASVQLVALPVAYIDGEEIERPPIKIPDVPVHWLGTQTAYVSTPIENGTPVSLGSAGLVIFTDRCLARWRQTGVPTDPVNGRAHDLADAVFVPGGPRPATQPIGPPTRSDAITVEGPLVALGALAASPAVLGTPLAAAFSVWASAIAGAASTLAAVPPATDLATALVLINANAAAIAAISGAHATLAGTVATWLSAKVLVQ